MKIVFLNIWNCEVQQNIEEFLKEQSEDTDVFCFQEAYEKTKWLCKDILSEYKLISDYKYIGNTEDFPQAIYIRKGIEILSYKTFLKNASSMGLALHTQLKYKDKTINICNVHGVALPGDKLDNESRIGQSQGIIDEYKDLKGMKIIGGDFNLDAKTKSIGLFEKNGYVDLIKKYKIPTTRNRFVWDRYPINKQYFSDYVFVNPSVPVTEFIVPNIEISDHLPMILSIDL
jgi:exonuclease III